MTAWPCASSSAASASPERGLTAMADVQRAGGIGGDEFDHDLDALTGPGTAEVGPLREDPRDDPGHPRSSEPDVQEARRRDDDRFAGAALQKRLLGNASKRLRELHRLLARDLRGLQGNARCKVTVLGIARPFQADAEFGLGRDPAKALREDCLDDVFRIFHEKGANYT